MPSALNSNWMERSEALLSQRSDTEIETMQIGEDVVLDRADGVGVTTAMLRADLPSGFNPTVWAITKTLSYPFINDIDVAFTAPLATLVVQRKVHTFLPISQLDTAQYASPPAHSDAASLAAVHTMIARAVGHARNVSLRGAKISSYWNDAAQTATWAGAINTYAERGPLTNISAATALTTNVVGRLKQRKPVILRGTYKKGATVATHWMLATLFTEDSSGNPLAVVANDPWTGRQVEIGLTTKTVTIPSGFPLSNFKVNGYQMVTLKPIT